MASLHRAVRHLRCNAAGAAPCLRTGSSGLARRQRRFGERSVSFFALPHPIVMTTIFVTAPKLAAAGVDLLAQAGARVLYLSRSGDAREVERIMASEPIDAVISRTVPLSARAIASCPALKVISKHGGGVGNIDVDAATRRGIPVYITPGANAQSVAELTLGLMFAAARRIGWMDAELHAGRWSRAQDGVQLCGKTLGLVGFGQIGQRVATV